MGCGREMCPALQPNEQPTVSDINLGLFICWGAAVLPSHHVSTSYRLHLVGVVTISAGQWTYTRWYALMELHYNDSNFTSCPKETRSYIASAATNKNKQIIAKQPLLFPSSPPPPCSPVPTSSVPSPQQQNNSHIPLFTAKAMITIHKEEI